MTWTPISEIPITEYLKGKQIINETVIDLGLKPEPIILKDAKLVQTEP